MIPDDIPIAAAATAAAGPTPTGRDVTAMHAAMDASIEYSRNVLGDAMVEVGAELDRVLRQRDANMDLTIGDLFNRANKSQAAVRKSLGTLERGLNDRMQDHINAARRELSTMDAALPVLYDEIAGYNSLGEHERLALENIILPAIQQQERELTAQVTAPLDTATKELPAVPGDITVKPLPGENLPTTDPIPVPGLPPDPVPGPDLGEQLPPPPSPPEPYPPGDDKCCPPQQIVVQAPPVYITLPPGYGTSPPASTSPPPSPPTSPPEPPDDTPSPPPPPPPPPPRSPPPPPPPNVVGPMLPTNPPVNDLYGAGTFDGPHVCARLTDAVLLAEQGKGEFRTPTTWIPFAQGAQSLNGIPVVGPLFASVLGAIGSGIDNVSDAVYQGMNALGMPNPSAAIWSTAGSMAFSLLDRWAGTDTRYYSQPLEQMGHYANPLNILGQSEIDATYLMGGLTQEQWTCMTRMNGNLPWQHWQAMFAKRSQLSGGELITAWRRGIIDGDALTAGLRGVGYLTDEDVYRAVKMSEYVPTTSEIFMWMTKDVANEEYVQIAKLDEDFDQSWNAQFQKWANANGLTDEQVMYQYRSQWKLPSKTQVDEFIRRLRPGRVGPDLQFTVEDAKLLYKLDEVPFGFRDRLIATSYQPVALSYLIEAYKAGTMQKPELVERCQDIGYSVDDAKFLTRMIVAKADGQFQGSIGAWTRRRIVQEYIDGTIDSDTADKLLSRTVLDPAKRTEAIGDADTIRDANARRKCIKGIHRRYFTGEFTKVDARRALLALGVQMTQVSGLLTGWECERTSRSKEPTVKMLTEWAQKGIITADQMHTRLVNLGYTTDDADRIVGNADQDFREKLRKQQAAAARQAAAAARRAAADAAKVLKKRKG